MSHDELSQLKNLIEEKFVELDEKSVQQRSSHHSDLTRQILLLDKKIDENTKITTDLTKHPIFKAWNDGKTIAKLIKWGGYALIGVSTVLIAIKNGGAILKEYIKL